LTVVEYLIKHAADVNQAINAGTTPLAIAIYYNQIDVAKLLLKKNANVETTKLFFKNNQFSELINVLDLIDVLDKLCKKIKRKK